MERYICAQCTEVGLAADGFGAEATHALGSRHPTDPSTTDGECGGRDSMAETQTAGSHDVLSAQPTFVTR